MDRSKSAERYRLPLFYLVASGVYLGIRIAVLITIQGPKLYPDSEFYLAIGSRSILSQDFWAAEYPVVIPVLYRLLGSNPQTIGIFQTGFSILAWLIFAWTMSRQMKWRFVAALAFVSILFFSLSAEILLWDWVVLSESVSASLFILFLAAWCWCLRADRWRPIRAVTLAFIGCIWMFARDLNATVILMFVIMICILVLFGWMDKRFLAMAGIFGLFFLLSYLSISVSGRWIGPNLNVLAARILPSPSAVAYYQQNGMPINETLLSMAGGRARRADTGFNDLPELKAFHAWHRENGKGVYLRFLLSEPLQTLLAPLRHLPDLIFSEPLLYYAPAGFSSIFPPIIDELVLFNSWNLPVLIISAGALVLFLFLVYLRRDRIWLFPATLVFLIYPVSFVIWHATAGGDASRHAYLFQLIFNIAIWVVALISLDSYLLDAVKSSGPLLDRFRYLLLGLGSGIFLISLFADQLFKLGDEFFIAYAQAAGMVLGALLVGVGIWRLFRDVKGERPEL